jgi:hypothetical protein
VEDGTVSVYDESEGKSRRSSGRTVLVGEQIRLSIARGRRRVSGDSLCEPVKDVKAFMEPENYAVTYLMVWELIVSNSLRILYSFHLLIGFSSSAALVLCGTNNRW